MFNKNFIPFNKLNSNKHYQNIYFTIISTIVNCINVTFKRKCRQVVAYLKKGIFTDRYQKFNPSKMINICGIFFSIKQLNN